MASSKPELIQYVPFTSFVNPSFWHALTEMKIEVDKLDDSTKQIFGRFTNRTDIGSVFEVDGTSYNKVPESSNNYINVRGTVLNRNTIEDFKNLDKAALINSVGEMIWSNIKKKLWITDPSSLLNFFILSFADLKKFQYFYWFAFPAPNQPIVHVSEKTTNLNGHILDHNDLEAIRQAYNTMDPSNRCYFILSTAKGELQAMPLSAVFKSEDIKQELDLDLEKTYFVFTDPSDGPNPGWPLRIFLAAILEHCPTLANKEIRVIGLRSKINGGIEDSLLFSLNLPEADDTEPPSWVGWERNEKGNFGPRLANMAASMDPIKLADTSSDLNIKLMKWRLVPNIDIEIMKHTKCLLLGAGTLGCHVARNLLAWGFRHITFIDNGKVSYSNPARQVLFTHDDCLNGGKKKAEAAADNLRNILPSVNTKGIPVHIPMPGHPIGYSLIEEAIANIKTITDAIIEHDVVFLLLDTREARWLPTLIAAHHQKIVINAALGFDSYLVMRHGISTSSTSEASVNTEYIPGDQLGCYFCNDVTAPGNSLKDRTLDQQCTVTRPGVAAIAGALAVELLVGLLQHPLWAEAPAVYNLTADSEPAPQLQGVLGPIPHSIRGFLHSYQQVVPTCAKFRQCIACSDTVVKLYREEGIEFLMKVFNSGKYLEKVTGLTELHLSAEMTDILTFSDDDAEAE